MYFYHVAVDTKGKKKRAATTDAREGEVVKVSRRAQDTMGNNTKRRGEAWAQKKEIETSIVRAVGDTIVDLGEAMVRGRMKLRALTDNDDDNDSEERDALVSEIPKPGPNC